MNLSLINLSKGGENMTITKYKVKLVRESTKDYMVEQIVSSSMAKTLLKDILKVEQWHNEKFILVCLDSKNCIIGLHTVAEGCVNSVSIHIREILTRALLNNAVGVILLHNHIGGTDKPSPEDINITLKIETALRHIDINLVDHFIYADENIVSMKENGYF